jgi:hypothetical protein
VKHIHHVNALQEEAEGVVDPLVVVAVVAIKPY